MTTSSLSTNVITIKTLLKSQRIASKLVESLAPEVAQALKDKPVTPLSGDIRDLPEAMYPPGQPHIAF